jgi:hypothetical protein
MTTTLLQIIIWATLILIIIVAASAMIHAWRWQATRRSTTNERLTMAARAAQLGPAARTTGITVILRQIADRPKASDQGGDGTDGAHPR